SALWCHYNWGYYGGGYGWRGGGPVTINVVNYNRFNRTNLAAGQNHWQFDAAHPGTVQFQNASLRQQFREPKNFQTFQNSRRTPQGNLQGWQGQFHIQGNQGNALQGNQGKFQGNGGQFNGKFQGNALQGNKSLGGSGTGNGKFNANTNVNSNAVQGNKSLGGSGTGNGKFNAN